MRSKAEIEAQLTHFRNDCAKRDTVENQHWIAALEWVLGDEKHRTVYEQWLLSITLLATSDTTRYRNTYEQALAAALEMTLARLR